MNGKILVFVFCVEEFIYFFYYIIGMTVTLSKIKKIRIGNANYVIIDM